MPKTSDPQTIANPFRQFAVDDVEPAAAPLWTEPLSNQVGVRFQRKLIMLPQPERLVVNEFGDMGGHHRGTPSTTLVSRIHPLVNAVHLAFSQHRPLTLSPDSIWLTISQGFTHHITENAEHLRHHLVRHTGQVELVENINAINIEQFQKAIAGFSSQIREASDPALHETLICDFSTTTPDIRTASEVVLMDCYASYFTYVMICICGIPKVTLTGTPDDWRRIRSRVEVLATFELDWWVHRLRPILDQLIATAEGKANLAFWQAIYKPRQTYGTETITGWIADLFPYLGNSSTQPGGSKRARSHIFEHERNDWIMPKGEGVSTRAFDPGAKFGVAPKRFPSGLASVPIKLMATTELQLDLVAGFLGVEQDEELSLSPVISWAATEKAPAEPVLVM
jgi:hypothetical protein